MTNREPWRVSTKNGLDSSPPSDRCQQPQSHRPAACKPMPAGPQRRRARDPQRQLDHTPTSRGKSPASGDVRCRSPHADPVGKWFRTASDNRRAIASTSLAPAPDRHRFGKGTEQIRSDLASVGFEKAGIANQTGARDVGVGDRHGSVRNKCSL